MVDEQDKRGQKNNERDPDLETSKLMNNLVIWNIKKAVENQPNLDLKAELNEAEGSLGPNINVTNLVTLCPHKRHISCALLAWQQLGHSNVDSLYSFYESQKMKCEKCPEAEKNSLKSLRSCATSPSNIPPALKLPCAESVVMRVGTTRSPRINKQKEPCHYTKNAVSSCDGTKSPTRKKPKIATCCEEPKCDERLAVVDKNCKELQQRLGRLAQREAERVRLLERAETTWVQLELEYTRRVQAVTDQEEDMERQIKKFAEERNNYKTVSSNLVQMLKPRGDEAEKLRETLREIEEKLCKTACERLKLAESAAKEDSCLSDMHCKHTQQDRELQFKEEKALRQKALMQGQIEAMRGLAYESDRAMRAELTGLKEQIKQVSKQLLSEDDKIKTLDEDIRKLQEEKDDIAEDVTNCQKKCDDAMQKKLDQLLEKKDKLQELQNQVLECKCKVPIDKVTQVKRSPSIAALCQCEPEFKALEGCSCTSLRTRLLSDLLKDLFGGLQSQMGDIAFRMPCQLLKCLENKHSWGKGSVTMNLTKFFSQLLVDELDIAIATSIENYHARWVGATCADIVKRPIPDPGGPELGNWEDRALAARAETMAIEMAEKMFQEKVDDVIAKATECATQGPPPCLCKPADTKSGEVAVYHVQVQPNVAGEGSEQRRPFNVSKDVDKSMKPNRDPDSVKSSKLSAQNAQVPGKQQLEKPSRLKVAAHTNNCTSVKTNKAFNLRKKASPMKPPLLKPAQFSSSETHKVIDQYWQRTQDEISQLRMLIEQSFEKKNSVIVDKKFSKYVNRGAITETSPEPSEAPKKEETKAIIAIDKDPNNLKETKKKKPKNNLRAYAMNYVCFCGMHRNKPKASGSLNPPKFKHKRISSKRPSKENKQWTPPITSPNDVKSCTSSCKCFNKVTTTSIDKFLNTLTQWNLDLNETSTGNETIQQTFGSLNNKITSSASKMYDPSKLICLSDVTNLCTIKGLPSKQSLDANKVSLETPPPLPVSNSEYIAAVNLDKSNEQCPVFVSNKNDKMIIDNEIRVSGQVINKNLVDTLNINRDTKQKGRYVERVLTKSSSQENSKASHNYHVISLNQSKMERELENVTKVLHVEDPQDKFATSQKYNILRFSRSKIVCVPLDPTLELEQRKTEHAVESLNKDSCVDVLNFNSSQLLHGPVCKKNLLNSEKKRYSTNSLQDTVAATKTRSACDCGYQIKFLGVTLANPSSDKQQNICENVYFHNLSRPIKGVIKNIDETTFGVEKNETVVEKNETVTTESNVEDSICQCNAKLDEIKALISNNMQKVEDDFKHNALQKDTVQNNTDKMPDTNSFINSNEIEHCVCCVKTSIESKNLETNTFQLLEEYLRKRLKERKSDQKHQIKPHDEDKIISKMFKRLRYAITEITNQVKCKCEDEVGEKGSWLRAYNLLQEYLKIKISRVQCSCSPFEENNNRQSLLPELTKKVCHLIENDFERLMECQKLKKSSNTIVDVISRDSPDNISDETLKRNSLFALLQKDFLVSLSAQVIPKLDSVSAQISPKLDEKCLKTENAEVKTVETQKSDIINNLIKDIFNQSTQYSNETIQEFYLTSEKLAKAVKNIDSKIGDKTNQEENASEYDELNLKCHTLDCTDINKLQENRAKINEIWKTHIENKDVDRHLASYIMDSVYKKEGSTNYMKDRNIHKEETHNTQHKVCDTKTSPFDITDLLLNDSKENVMKSLRHVRTCSSLKNRISKVSDDDLYFARCPHISDQIDQIPMKKYVHFPASSSYASFKHNVNEHTERELVDVPDISISNCDCDMVPLCHVNMLIENIETKLQRSDCTCDSLVSSVCPVHACTVQSDAKKC